MTDNANLTYGIGRKRAKDLNSRYGDNQSKKQQKSERNRNEKYGDGDKIKHIKIKEDKMPPVEQILIFDINGVLKLVHCDVLECDVLEYNYCTDVCAISEKGTMPCINNQKNIIIKDGVELKMEPLVKYCIKYNGKNDLQRQMISVKEPLVQEMISDHISENFCIKTIKKYPKEQMIIRYNKNKNYSVSLYSSVSIACKQDAVCAACRKDQDSSFRYCIRPGKLSNNISRCVVYSQNNFLDAIKNERNINIYQLMTRAFNKRFGSK